VHPAQGSRPILNDFPVPTNQASLFPITVKASCTDFHMTEISLEGAFDPFIQGKRGHIFTIYNCGPKAVWCDQSPN